jgi:hypothetical protein
LRLYSPLKNSRSLSGYRFSEGLRGVSIFSPIR